MMKSFLLVLPLLACAVATQHDAVEKQEDDQLFLAQVDAVPVKDYKYPTLRQVNDLLDGKALDVNNFHVLPAANSIWEYPGSEVDYASMAKAVMVVLQCPEGKSLPNDFPTDVMFELLSQRLNTEPIGEEKRYARYEVGDQLKGINKIEEKMTGNLEYDLGINLDDIHRDRDLQLRGSSGHRELGYAKCPKCNDCEASICMVVDMGSSRRLKDGDKDDNVNAAAEKALTAAAHLEIQSKQLKDVAKNEREAAMYKEDLAAQKIAEEKHEVAKYMKEQSKLMTRTVHLSLNTKLTADNLKDLLKDVSKEGVEKFANKLEYTFLKMEDILLARQQKKKDKDEASKEEEKRQKELRAMVAKYQKEWDKAVEKIEGFFEQVKAAGAMEEALNNVVEWFDQVYDMDCYVRVVRLA